jgi:hypothetical protein
LRRDKTDFGDHFLKIDCLLKLLNAQINNTKEWMKVIIR